MRTVQLTLDEELVDAVDRIARQLGTTRSGFTREALRAALARSKEREQERKHRSQTRSVRSSYSPATQHWNSWAR